MTKTWGFCSRIQASIDSLALLSADSRALQWPESSAIGLPAGIPMRDILVSLKSSSSLGRFVR
ncbi:MAG: hypothetical protein CMQ16_07705 [Gammaproteobacteria bacterium]|nr:hypothetical protein [Gammaproteobacteria bacterium]